MDLVLFNPADAGWLADIHATGTAAGTSLQRIPSTSALVERMLPAATQTTPWDDFQRDRGRSAADGASVDLQRQTQINHLLHEVS